MKLTDTPTVPAGTNVPPTFTESVAATLHRAATAYRSGEIRWGREWFVRPADGCRCALGAITYAVNPANTEGNPRHMTANDQRYIALAAADALATYLVHELDAVPAYDGHVLDVVETVGNWNDEQPTSAPVIAALDAAAEHQA